MSSTLSFHRMLKDCDNYTGKREVGFLVKQVKAKGRIRVSLTWQMLDVGGQQLGFLLLIALLRDVT